MLRNPTPHDPYVLQQHIPMLSSSVLELPSSSSYEYNDGDVDDKKWLELLGE